MKTHLFFSALALVMLMTACQKDELVEATSNTFAPPPSERCGCLPPVTFEAQNVTDVSAVLQWDAMPEAVAYRLEVRALDSRIADDDFTNAYVIETAENDQISLSNLIPDTRYKYRVTTICRVMDSSVSETMYFETQTTPHGDPPDVYLPKVSKHELAVE